MGKKRKKVNDLQEIEVKTENILEIRIGFTVLALSRMLGSGEQFDKTAWGVIGAINPELAKTLLAEPRDGPYSGGYRVQVGAFRKDSIAQLHKKVAEWSKTILSTRDIIIQQFNLVVKTTGTGNVDSIPIILVTVLKCERERPSISIWEKAVLKPV